MSVQLPNRDALAKWTGNDQRTIKFLEDLTASTNASADALAGAVFGGLGTYAFVRRLTANVPLTAGTTYAGSDLAYAGFRSNGASFTAATGGAVLSGTWLAMGTATPSGGDFAFTLALRVA